MGEKRQHKRSRKRLTVKYGEKDFALSGFTGDISRGGMFIVAARLMPLDTRLHLQLFMDSTRFLVLEGEVRRHKIIPSELRTVEKQGFGVRFLHPGQVVAEAVGAAAPQFELHYGTKEEFKAAFEKELRMGAVYIPTSSNLARDAQVGLEVCLDYANKSFELEATVVHITKEGEKVVGIGVMLNGREQAIAQLKACLG